MLASKEVKVKKVTVKKEEIQSVTLILTEKEASRIRNALRMMSDHAYNRNRLYGSLGTVSEFDTLDRQLEELNIPRYYFH